MSKTEYEGVIGKAVKVEAADDKVCMTLPIKELAFGENSRDQADLIAVASYFKHMLFENFSLHSLKPSDVYLVIEVPEKLVRPEVRLWLDNHDGAGYATNQNEIDETDLTRFMPRVVDVSGDNDEEDE